MLDGELAGVVFVTRTTQVASKETNKVTTVLEGNDAIPNGGDMQDETKIAVRVKLDRINERIVELEQGTKLSRVLEIVAAERACDVRELALVREGENQPLTLGAEVVVGDPHKQFHHIHYVGEVKVTIYYQDSQDSREFKRFETVKDVLAWAIKAFKIDASMATELVLVYHGQQEELPEHEHIGHLTEKSDDLAIDLVRGDIANGSPS